MSNKALTVLIADEQHLRRLHIEKMLNRLGYFRIVPVQTLDEVEILTSIPAASFGALIINASLADSCPGDLTLNLGYPQIEHVLIYDSHEQTQTPTSPAKVLMRLPGAPDNVTLEHFMDLIDPPPPAGALRVLPWLRELARA